MSNIQIYQIYYNEETKKSCKPYFISYNNSKDTSNEYEYGVLKKIYLQPWDGVTHKGVLSWKFEDKINLWLRYHTRGKTNHQFSDKKFYDRVQREAKNYDIITMNIGTGWPNNLNVWSHGEQWRRGTLKCLDEFTNDNADCSHWKDIKFTHKTLIFCNYWIATKKFWDIYMSYAERLYPYAKQTDIFPYIMERVAPSVLHDHQSEFKILDLGY